MVECRIWVAWAEWECKFPSSKFGYPKNPEEIPGFLFSGVEEVAGSEAGFERVFAFRVGTAPASRCGLGLPGLGRLRRLPRTRGRSKREHALEALYSPF